MTSLLLIWALALVVTLVTPTAKIGCGLLSRPWWRWRLLDRRRTSGFMFSTLAIIFALVPFKPELTWVILAVLAVDDYLNGGDDDFRRRWEGVRNRVKWLMKLPAPDRTPRTA